MICCQLVEWTLFLSFFLDSGIYNYIMDHLVSVKLNLVVNTLEWLLKAWSDIATCGLGGIHRLWLEGMEGGSHHITEEELWLEQKAFREGGHITSLRRDCGENRRHEGRRVTSLGRDWSVTRMEDTQGYSHLWTSFGLWGREVSMKVFQDSYLALRWKFLFQV